MEAPDGQDTTSALDELRSQTNVLAGKSGAKSKAWKGLRESLTSLKGSPVMFGPIASAANVLLDCFDTIEVWQTPRYLTVYPSQLTRSIHQVAARNKKDYEDLATELGELSRSLARDYKEPASSSGASCVIGIAKYVAD
jgi:hypothetical protein